MHNINQRRISGLVGTFIVVILLLSDTYGNYAMNRYDLHNVNGLEYRQNTIHSGSAVVRGHNDIGPQYNRDQFHLERRDTLASTNMQHSNGKRRTSQKRACVKCPGEVMAVAKQGLDGILVEPPAPVSCTTNLPFSRDLYQIETLFGSQFLFVLPHGKHSLFAKIRNIETGLVEHTCPLKYNVIVRRCPRYRLKNPYLKMYCSTGTVWGSSCAFECHDPNAVLSHQEPMVCSESLEWIGQEPSCRIERDIVDNSITIQPNAIGACQLPPPPANGKFSCELNRSANNLIDPRSLAAGSVCRIHCDQFYTIPYHLRAFSVLECENGAWNTTMMDFCYRQRNQRQLPRRHQNQHFRERQPARKRVRITTYA